jgi:hypothetical protein
MNLRNLCMAFAFSIGVVSGAGGARADDETAWPRELGDKGYKVLIYQPQLESFSGNVLQGRFAVSVTPKKDKKTPIFGAAWFEGTVATDSDTRIVSLQTFKITAANFPDQDSTKVQQLTRYLEKEIPKWEITVTHDDLVASLEAGGGHVDEALKHDPPEMIFSTEPAVLVLIDGEPKLQDLPDFDVQYVVNSPFFIALEPITKAYYLKGGAFWYMSADVVKAPWKATDAIPKPVKKVAEQIAEDEKKQAAEAKARGEEGDTPPKDEEPPKVIVRTHPAELLLTEGEAALAPLEGTNLLYVTNTENDILMDITGQTYYILASGRWYSSKTLTTDGPWTFVPNDRLPAEFGKIPSDSDMSQVLASVAGTQEAKEALLENDIPQTAEVDRKTTTVAVSYDGDPKFEACGEGVAYALNTDKTVLLVEETYYCCDKAIWFLSKAPAGPWEVATSVPAQIQNIPPDCPAYNVKYVQIYDSTPEVVYVGYTPAYYGSYVYAGCVVYGTGYVYQPWYGAYYYPRPVTWGFGVHYSPYGGWGFSYGVSFGWLHVSVHSGYGAYWGPAGYHYGYRHGYAHGYNHGYYHGARAGYRAGYRAGQASGSNNLYRNRGEGVRTSTRPSTQPARGGRQQAARPGTQPARGGQAGASNRAATGAGAAGTRQTPKAANTANNVYADRDGNVYRQNGNDWQKRSGDSWSSSKGSSNVQKDAQARQRSTQRSQQSRSATQSRPRGGGGRRR